MITDVSGTKSRARRVLAQVRLPQRRAKGAILRSELSLLQRGIK
jgi:hypothetical protein